jgi:hypothetical protein
MRLPTLVGSVVWACVAAVGGLGVTNGQSAPRCPYSVGAPTVRGCVSNASPAPIPSGLGGGNRMTAARCASEFIHAIASLHSYDDFICHPSGTVTGGSRHLKLLHEATDFFPPNYKINAQRSSFHGTLYCETASNTLILAFRGSVSLTPFLDRDQIDDWFQTNFLQHLGPRPLQYQYAEDAAALVEQDWRHGLLDDICGSGRPRYLLTGHSKGGGQAQFAGARTQVGAVVFNADLANPVIFSDWMVAPQVIPLTPAVVQSYLGCRAGQFDPSLRERSSYFASGNVKDIRMTNDPLTEKLIWFCDNNLPHAPIEWLSNSLSCSRDGHGIETIIRELTACAGP